MTSWTERQKALLSRAAALIRFEDVWREYLRQNPHIQPNDKVAQRALWKDWMDALLKDGQITEKQYNTWSGPPGLWRVWEDKCRDPDPHTGLDGLEDNSEEMFVDTFSSRMLKKFNTPDGKMQALQTSDDEGEAWDIYIKHRSGVGFIKIATIPRHKWDTPRQIWKRYNSNRWAWARRAQRPQVY